MSQTPHLRNRYPGLASFTTSDKDLFFGRKQETRELANFLSVERTVVLFSASGLGKTSLLQAGVMPLLYGQLMVPVPIRFGTAALLPEQHFSIQLDAAHRRFSSADDTKAADSSARESFWAQIARQPFGQAPALFTPLFIFDQFEELFTLYPEREKRARFVAELADIIQERIPAALRGQILEGLDEGNISSEAAAALEKAPPMKFIFSIRSDMLHFMDELSEAIPYILRSRFQLFGLGQSQATEALVAPAGLVGTGFQSRRFGYSENAQAEILEVLGKKGEVESFQLQAVCQAIEEKIIRSARQKFDATELLEKSTDGLPLVAPDFYGSREGLDAILDESYNRRLDGLASNDASADWPETARLLLEGALVTPNDRRQSVDREVLLLRPGVSPALLDELEKQRLVRKEPRLDSFYYEISHDTWLKPVLNSRKLRLGAEEKEAERVAAEEAQRRVKEAEELAVAEKRRAEDAERLQKLAENEKKNAQKMMFLAIGLAGLASLATLGAGLMYDRSEKSSDDAKEAQKQAEVALDTANVRLHALQQEKAKTAESRGDSFFQNLEYGAAKYEYEQALKLQPENTGLLKKLEACSLKLQTKD